MSIVALSRLENRCPRALRNFEYVIGCVVAAAVDERTALRDYPQVELRC